ncbi:MAG: TetR/AcrR family transcriptional regulator [Pseudomonadota bacterium]
MSDTPIKRRQPKIMRKRILDAATEAIIDEGVDGLTLDEVARRAEVSKGGLLHHYSSKQVLHEALFDYLLSDLEETIAELIDANPHTLARFSLAYFDAVCNPNTPDYDKKRGVFFALFAVQPELAERWASWLQDRMVEHAATDDHAMARVLRLAADGLWASNMIDGPDSEPANREDVTLFLKNLFRS